MELEIIQEEKNKISVLVKGEDHTFCNALRDELNNDKDVAAAAYRIEHPLLDVPTVFVQTKSGNPKKALKEAAKRLKKNLEAVKKAV